MKKLLLSLSLCTLMLLSACSETEKTVSGSPSDIVNNNMSSFTFYDEMTNVDNNTAFTTLGVDANIVTDAYIMQNSGKSNEIFAVFQAENAEFASDTANDLEVYVSSLYEQAVESENSDNKNRLVNDKFIGVSGNYTYILVCSDGDNAESIIESIF